MQLTVTSVYKCLSSRSHRLSIRDRIQTKIFDTNANYLTLHCTALNMPANLENSAVATGLEKVSFHSNPKKGNAKECSNYRTIALISHASKLMLKLLQARLQQYMNCELPDVQAGFRKGRGTRDQIANVCLIIKKAREHQ